MGVSTNCNCNIIIIVFVFLSVNSCQENLVEMEVKSNNGDKIMTVIDELIGIFSTNKHFKVFCV